MLEVRNLCKSFGALAVTQGVNLRLAPGARHALIGPNGAGKTTLVNLLTGVLRPDQGEILLGGRGISALPQHERARLGLARTHQINSLFMDLTPHQSVSMAIGQREGLALRLGSGGRGARIGEEASAILASLGLQSDAHERTRALPYGRQRLLEVGLALASKPKVLLLDEPAAGVSAEAAQRLFEVIARLPADLAILLIEHDMRLVFRFARSISVLVRGAVLAEGTPADMAADPRVREAYLGTNHAA